MQDHGTISAAVEGVERSSHVAGSEFSVVKRLLLAAVLVASAGGPTAYLAFRSPARSGSLKRVQEPAPGSNLEQVIAQAHSDPSPSNRLNLSAAYINANRPDLAIRELKLLVKAQPELARAWSNLCVAHTMQRNYRLAIEACHVALRLDPNFRLAKNNLKWTEDERDEAVQELKLLEKQTPVGSRNEMYYMTAGLLQLHIGNYDDAIALWKEALSLNPQDAAAANNVGTAYMLEKQPDVAIPWFQRALILDPTSQLAKNNLSWAADEKRQTN